ncbi:zinc finger CCHC-type containing 10 [Aspergillus tanneri]|uniref:Uncharacterized protein n=1 Tax=Aspergillus tanneri TaxID=1220188 RepID=A0A5M9MZB8_9EURO|nr:uncharacterized protein ATNIH1004_001102 [Aspergillus tanneri]KAA8652198.1 hypothetical protein ATNIH1004_001102 [Aspergillus tanneri]
MNRYRNAPGVRGPSKATATTLCQKCLKRDIYECTVSAQERPYASRPSRTQQLLNPNLRPQLSTEVPNDLLRTKGLADELLTKREEERGRKRDLDEFDPLETEGQTSKELDQYRHILQTLYLQYPQVAHVPSPRLVIQATLHQVAVSGLRQRPLVPQGQERGDTVTRHPATQALLSRQKKGLVHSRATGRMIGILDEGTEYPVQGNVAARRTYPGTEVAEDEVGVGV